MYIIGGKLKGRKLTSTKGSTIRPAMALVRKSIFDILGNFACGANVLDLCAGTGSLGIEALSRGADKLTLVDSDKGCIKLIYKNLEICDLRAKVIFGKLPKVLNKIHTNEQFDLIFFDPPYGKKDFIEKVLDVIILNKLVANEGLVSIETEAKCDFTFPDDLIIYKVKKYGNTKVTFLQMK